MTTAKKPVNAISEIRESLSAMGPQFKKALPSHISPDRFARVVMTAIQTNPSLLNYDRQSLYGACMNAAQDGLLPDGKEAALVPYKGKVQYQPMVAGILKKVRNSGELASIASQIVHQEDSFRYWVDGDGEHLEHSPKMFADRGNPIGVYALAKTKDGGIYVEVMTKAQIEDVRKSSSAKGGPWEGAFASEMWRKTVIRRLSKRLPMSSDLEQVIQRADDLYNFDRKQVSQDKGHQLAALISAPVNDEAEYSEVDSGFDSAEPEIVPSYGIKK